MSEIEREFEQLLERTDPAELDMYSPIASQEMSEELLGVVSAPADDTSSTSGMAPRDGACGELCAGGDLNTRPRTPRTDRLLTADDMNSAMDLSNSEDDVVVVNVASCDESPLPREGL